MAEKIMVICKVLDVTPEWLLSGIEAQGDRGNHPPKVYAIYADTEVGQLVTSFNSMNQDAQTRLMGYVEALKDHMGHATGKTE